MKVRAVFRIRTTGLRGYRREERKNEYEDYTSTVGSRGFSREK
jgi:hypothetical protein